MTILTSMQIVRQQSPTRTSARGDLRRLTQGINDRALKKSSTKLWCSSCRILSPIRQVFTGSRTCQLECGCRRTLANLGEGQTLKSQIAKLEVAALAERIRTKGEEAE